MATTYSPVTLTNLDISSTYRSIMDVSTGVDSIYIRAKETLIASVTALELSEQDKAKLIATTISGMVTSITAQSMEMAFKVEKENRDSPYVLTKMQEDTKLVTANVAKTEADVLQMAQQTLLITAQKEKTAEEKALLVAQTGKVGSDKLNVEAQTLKIGADKLNVEAQTLLTTQQEAKVLADTGFVETQKKVAVYNGWKTQAELMVDYGINVSGVLTTTDMLVTGVVNPTIKTGTKHEQTRQAQAQVYNTYATTYRNVGAVTGLTIGSTGILTAATADNEGLLYWQKEVAKRQKQGFDDNMRQHVANSAASTASMLYALNDDAATTEANKILFSFGTAVSYLNGNSLSVDSIG